MSNDRYELIDFGNGRKLESLSGYLVDRPSPAAEQFSPRDPARWKESQSRFNRESKSWSHREPWPEDLCVDCGAFRMPLRPTPFGHIGLFPEQFPNWQWLGNLKTDADSLPLNALNLFGYTGASTIALSKAGFQVAHVDAAKPNVQSLRKAAQVNSMVDAPIRYLVDDAVKFTAREVRRQRRYHTIVLDPPAYGHSPKGKAWRLERDLWPLLDDCLKLLSPESFRILITGHSPQIDQNDVAEYLQTTRFMRGIGSPGLLLTVGRSQLKDARARRLDTGFYVRAESRPN